MTELTAKLRRVKPAEHRQRTLCLIVCYRIFLQNTINWSNMQSYKCANSFLVIRVYALYRFHTSQTCKYFFCLYGSQ